MLTFKMFTKDRAECQRLGISNESIERIEKLQTKYMLVSVVVIGAIFLIHAWWTQYTGQDILSPFKEGRKNLQWLTFLLQSISTLFFIKGAFKSKYRIALETATAGQTFLMELRPETLPRV